MAPPLRIPLGLNMSEFEKNINDAKSKTRQATQFLIKEFAQTQLKLIVNQDEFRPAVQRATKFLGDEFQKVKPIIQDMVRTSAKETAEAGVKVASVFGGPAIKGTFQGITAVGIPAVQGMATALLPLALRFTAIAAAVTLVSDAIGAARKQLEDMVALQEKASKFTLGTQFIQLFEAEARKLKVTVEDLDAALENAFNATKDKAPIDVAKYEVAKERITDIELALRVFNNEIAKAQGTELKGLVAFRDATTQEGKIRAVLQAMVELNNLGQKAASLDIAERMFGQNFADKIRQGKTSAESILSTMEKVKASGDGLFDEALAKRAKDVDDQLKLAQDRLSRAMKPSLDGIASIILDIKGYWGEVVDLIAKAVEQANKLGQTAQRIDLKAKASELEEVNKALQNGTGLYGIPRIPGADTLRSLTGQKSIDEELRERSQRLRGEIDELNRTLNPEQFGPNKPAAPSRGAGAVPTLKNTGSERDGFDAAIDGIRKRTAALEADTKAIDDGTYARERAKNVALLQEAAIRANTAAGLKNTEVTKEQNAEIQKNAEAFARATEAAQKARIGSDIAFNKATAFLSQEDVQIASALRGIYPDIATALRSVEAEGMRTVNSMRELSSIGQETLRDLGSDFAAGIREGTAAWESFKNAGVNALNRIADKLIQMATDNLWKSAFGGIGGGGFLSSLFGGTGGGTTLSGTDWANLNFPRFANGTNNAPGGLAWVGEEGPELMNVPKGAQIIPNDIIRNSTNNGYTINFNPVIDARGASDSAVARIEQNQRRMMAELDARIKNTVRDRPNKRW